MTSRKLFLVGASLCAAMALTQPASAQSDVSLRASYQGNFLPEATEIVVLSKEARVRRDGRYQPEFFPTRDFPRSIGSVLGRDRIGDTGRSSRSYAGTQAGGRLYFIYALAPDSTLYWSYSAQRDSLKYDVVSTGVMSVAPVLVSEIRDEILGRYFRQRVTVVMRGDGEEEGEEEETVELVAGSVGGGLHQDSLAAAAGATEASPASSDTAATGQDTVSSGSRVPPVASATPPSARDASSGVSASIFWSLLLVLFAVAAVPAYLARTYRNELKQARREMLAFRDRVGSNGDPEAYESEAPELPDAARHEIARLRTSLEDAELRCQQLEDDYDILEARYAALEKELEAQRI